MQARLSKKQSLALHCNLVKQTWHTLCASKLCDIELCVSEGDDAFFKALIPPPKLTSQHGYDLGQRMHNAIEAGLQNYQSVLLVGSDCPSIDEAYLFRALKALEEKPVVVGPAEDGGYVLIGMKYIQPKIFEHVSWGTAQVLAQTRQGLVQEKREWTELPTLADIDRPVDLSHIKNLAEMLTL